MRYPLAVLAMLVTTPGLAEVAVTYPATIPQECFELAHREAVPTTIANKFEAMHAKNKLARLKDSDPLVLQCRQAVERERAALRSAGKSVPGE
jgi:hypothetical protein